MTPVTVPPANAEVSADSASETERQDEIFMLGGRSCGGVDGECDGRHGAGFLQS